MWLVEKDSSNYACIKQNLKGWKQKKVLNYMQKKIGHNKKGYIKGRLDGEDNSASVGMTLYQMYAA